MTRREVFAAAMGAALAFLLTMLVHRGEPADRPAPRTSVAPSGAAAPGAPSSDEEGAWRTANANLAETVRRTQARLEENDREKQELERQLRTAQAQLAASGGDGGPKRNEFDLTPDDWKDLAKTGTIKSRYPCSFEGDWHLSPEQANALGLSPDDAAAVERAYLDEEDRIAGVIQPGCAKVLGNAELARRLGPKVCTAVLTDSVKDPHPAMQLVADIEAGNLPRPAPEHLDPLASLLLAEADSMHVLQADLAKTFGPEEAHRLAFADELGSCSGTWGGPAPKP
jgi:hypothetical protein